MLRPMVATTAVTAALLLLAGCGGNDKKSDSGSGTNGSGSTSSPTPSAPSIPSFDPPKAFTAAAAFPVPKVQTREIYDEAKVGMVGPVALIGHYDGLIGNNIADPSKSWTVKSTTTDTTTVSGVTAPVGVKLDGKDVAIVAYAEADKGNGTQKPQGLVLIQWIDVDSGQKVAEISAPVSTVDGTGPTAAGTPNLTSLQFDPDNGQVAVAGNANGRVTVFADPKMQKATVIPGVSAAAVHGGVVAAVKASNNQSTADGTVVLADGASGKITKQIPLKQVALSAIAGGAKHAYFYGTVYKESSTGTDEVGSLFSVDLASGAVVKSAPGLSARDSGGYGCVWDQATSIVCRENQPTGPQEILGFDDTTGKKVWGWNSLSGERVVPEVTAALHGVVYVQTEKQAVLLDAKTGQDLPSPTPSATPNETSPSTGGTPSDSGSPTAGDTPSDSGTPSPSDGSTPGGSDMSQYNGTPESPDAVSPYGGVYTQFPTSNGLDVETVAVYLKPTA
ncbi:hypothetical protein GCM10009630_59720 [Kribbella jejuensis]|uniref:Pyrroloquinoline-quinone binding quinoprotein n=1 Tax=Kribbella jejuensis TaxID=236068 RepID=A0A542EU33_9ACTN|nr:hypothetical protein [Kribbella jejuensis]TQJ18684.1 hypothetical protein FB475_2833 [Kribbella jejuensis]